MTSQGDALIAQLIHPRAMGAGSPVTTRDMQTFMSDVRRQAESIAKLPRGAVEWHAVTESGSTAFAATYLLGRTFLISTGEIAGCIRGTGHAVMDPSVGLRLANERHLTDEKALMKGGDLIIAKNAIPKGLPGGNLFPKFGGPSEIRIFRNPQAQKTLRNGLEIVGAYGDEALFGIQSVLKAVPRGRR